MKRCNACGEEFKDRFSFCPVDGTPLATVAGANTAPSEFQLTLIGDEGLARRLANADCIHAVDILQGLPSFHVLSREVFGNRRLRLGL